MQKHVYKASDTDICRECRIGETIYHIISGCSVLSETKYLKRHNDLAKYVHAILLLKRYGFVETLVNWYEHQPRYVEEHDNAKILWHWVHWIFLKGIWKKNLKNIDSVDDFKKCVAHKKNCTCLYEHSLS